MVWYWLTSSFPCSSWNVWGTTSFLWFHWMWHCHVLEEEARKWNWQNGSHIGRLTMSFLPWRTVPAITLRYLVVRQEQHEDRSKQMKQGNSSLLRKEDRLMLCDPPSLNDSAFTGAHQEGSLSGRSLLGPDTNSQPNSTKSRWMGMDPKGKRMATITRFLVTKSCRELARCGCKIGCRFTWVFPLLGKPQMHSALLLQWWMLQHVNTATSGLDLSVICYCAFTLLPPIYNSWNRWNRAVIIWLSQVIDDYFGFAFSLASIYWLTEFRLYSLEICTMSNQLCHHFFSWLVDKKTIFAADWLVKQTFSGRVYEQYFS